MAMLNNQRVFVFFLVCFQNPQGLVLEFQFPFSTWADFEVSAKSEGAMRL